jgi:hypothetical protein
MCSRSSSVNSDSARVRRFGIGACSTSSAWRGTGELARQICAGAWDDRHDRLRSVLASLARDQLAIAEPRHLTIPIATGDTP